jgi:glycosyltransferase involved in cell wall biosynthesis
VRWLDTAFVFDFDAIGVTKAVSCELTANSSGVSLPSLRLRIAHVTLGLATGGQERLLVEFVRHADLSRFEPIIVSLTDRGLLAETLETHGAKVIALNEAGGLRPALVHRLKRFFETERIDIVHTHDDRPLIYGVPAGRWAGRRVIHTQHHGKLPNVGRKQEFLVRWTGRWAHAFVTVSRDAARHYIAQGVPSQRVLTIWNGIDLGTFRYQGPQAGGPAVTVARLSPEKNIENLLRAAARVRERDPAFRLEIAGDGPCREGLVQLVQELNIGSVVKFLGEVRDIPSLLARASLFVLPSKSEGISLTLLEAMARGLPVIATSVGGNPEVVVDGKTGCLVPSDDPTALAAALVDLRSRAANAREMGQAGRRRVEECFDVRGMVARYERLYLGDMDVPIAPVHGTARTA